MDPRAPSTGMTALSVDAYGTPPAPTPPACRRPAPRPSPWSWWDTLAEADQVAIDAHVRELERRGPTLPFPYSSGIEGSRHGHLRELRVQSGGRPLRIFYAFDPRRVAILLIGGDKTGDDRFYERMVRMADRLYDEHLEELEKEKRHGR